MFEDGHLSCEGKTREREGSSNKDAASVQDDGWGGRAAYPNTALDGFQKLLLLE
jgi:hypothetical protein